MTSKTTKSMIVAALIAAFVIPTSVIAFDYQSMTAEEELALAQNHVDKLYVATVEKNNIETGDSSTEFASQQQKVDRITELEVTILNETRILAELEAQSISKYTLDSDFKSQKELATEIFRSIPKTDDTPYLGMTLGDDRKSLVIGIDIAKLTTEKNQQYYEKFIQKEFAEISVPIEVSFQEKKGGDQSCNYRTSDCNPTWGGVYMEGEHYITGKCTVGLPYEKGTTKGWITAGHCVGDGYYELSNGSEDVGQPYDSNAKIGEATVLVYEDECDCAFIEKTSSDSWYEGRVWYGYNTYTTMNWYTDLVSNGSYVIMTGAPSGPKLGIVDDNDSTSTSGTFDFEVVELTTDISQDKDSGAPYTNTAKNTFYGIHKGLHDSSDNSIFFAWGNIESELGL